MFKNLTKIINKPDPALVPVVGTARYFYKFSTYSSLFLQLIIPLVSKRLFSTALNLEGYSHGSNSPINLQFLQLESHGYQLSGAKNRTVLSCSVQILLQSEYEKVVKNQKKSAHCKTHC
jgi:hypothetical protein